MKNRKGTVMIVGGVLVALAIGVTSILALQNKKQPEQVVVLEKELRQSKVEEKKIVSEEWIFYQDDNILWKVKTDGSNKIKVLDLDKRITWAYLE